MVSTVIIFEILKIHLNHLFTSGLPQILPSNDEFVKVKSGENLTLKCDVTGFPQSRIYWTLESHKILDDESHFEMTDCSVRNSGVYICNAQNDIGIAQKVYYVTVTGLL